jgi:putative ABC transport system permease protein
VSFSVIQRSREIGIRRAIGATTADILRLVVGGHFSVIALGLFIGVTIGALGAIVFRSFLAGVGPADPFALFAVVIVAGGSAFLASTLPALRATRFDPITALRDM